MSAIIGDLDQIANMEKELRNRYNEYLSICSSIQYSMNSLRKWTGLDNYFMLLRAGQGLSYFRSQAVIVNNQADYLNRWRNNMSYAQDTMLNMVSRLG